MEGERVREDTPSQHLTKSSVELSVSADYSNMCECVCVCVYTFSACAHIIRQFNMSDVCALYSNTNVCIHLFF